MTWPKRAIKFFYKVLKFKFYGFIQSRKRSIFVIDSYLKDSAFTAVKGIQSSNQRMWKGYHLSLEGIRKGDLSREKCILKGKGLNLGAELPRINIC